ncbi:MAG: hypothetical protein WKF84_11530 [Pyrinomonadaceae bacterium]
MNNGRDKLLLQSSEDQISSFEVRGRYDLRSLQQSRQALSLRHRNGRAKALGELNRTRRKVCFYLGTDLVAQQGSGGASNAERQYGAARCYLERVEYAVSPIQRDRRLSVPRSIHTMARGAASGYAPADVSAMVEDINLAYLPHNVAPEVLMITTLPPNVGLQSAVQIQTDPNVEASGLNPAIFGGIAQIPPRRIFQRGAVSLQWQAEDRNGDELEYALYYRAVNENTFRLLKDELRDNFYTVDSAALSRWAVHLQDRCLRQAGQSRWQGSQRRALKRID